MSPTPVKPLTISVDATTAHVSQSTLGSPTTSSPPASPSTAGVYIPVHRRAQIAVAATPRTLPIYTLAELVHLAESPLAQDAKKDIKAALLADEALSGIVMSRRQRSKQYNDRQTLEKQQQQRVPRTVGTDNNANGKDELQDSGNGRKNVGNNENAKPVHTVPVMPSFRRVGRTPHAHNGGSAHARLGAVPSKPKVNAKLMDLASWRPQPAPPRLAQLA